MLWVAFSFGLLTNINTEAAIIMASLYTINVEVVHIEGNSGDEHTVSEIADVKADVCLLNGAGNASDRVFTGAKANQPVVRGGGKSDV